MTEKRFRIYKEDKFKEEWYGYPFHIKDGGEKVTETMPMNTAKEVANLLNSLGEQLLKTEKQNKGLKEENEQLKKELDSFKAVMFQDRRKGTVILYSKGD